MAAQAPGSPFLGPPLSPSEEEFQAKEKEITERIIHVVSLVKKENADVVNEELRASVVEACKAAVGQTLNFQNTMKGCRQPYITHSKQLEVCLKSVDGALLNVEDVLVSARSESSNGEASATLGDLRAARVHASDTIAAFRRWLYTNDASYLFATDRSLEAPEPVHPDVAKQDMLRCPRWMLFSLVEARRGMMQAEEQWQQYLKETNELKAKLAQVTDQTALKDEIKKKDELIKKLNSGLRMLYQDMEKKSSQIKEQDEELRKRADQIKSIAKGSNSSAAQIAAQEASDSQTKRLSAALAKAEDEGKKDKEELKKLRGEVQRMKYLLKERASMLLSSPSGNSFPGSAPGSAPDLSDAAHEALNRSVAAAAAPSVGSVTPYAQAQFWLTSGNKRQALSKLLLQEDDWSFVDALGKSIAAGQEAEETARLLVKLFIKQDTHMPVLEYLIKQEVNRTKSVNTLFRGEELSSRVLRVYTRKRGKKYAHKVLYELIKEVSDNNYNYEIDPNRSDPSMNLKQNFTALESLTQRFLDRILISFQWVPAEFLKLCNTICVEASKRYEKSEDLAVAGFIFLRFLCPAITAPETFGIMTVANPEARRTLLLIGKILQNLANGVQFKEDFLVDMNRFLTKNELPTAEFFKKMRTFPPAIDGEAEYMRDLERITHTRREKLHSNLEAFNLAKKSWDLNVSTRLDDRAKAMLKHVSSATVQGLESEPHKVQAFAGMLMDNEDFLPQLAILLVVEQDQDIRKKLADALVTISNASGEMEFLSRSVVQTEVSQSFTAYNFLHASFTRSTFIQYTTRFCREWLDQAAGEVLGTIIADNAVLEIDEARLDDAAKKGFNKAEAATKLIDLSRTILQGFLDKLPSAPKPLWAFANILAHNTSQDPFQFFVLNYWCSAVQNPAAYGLLDEQPKREATRALQLISDVMRAWANKTESFEGIAIDQAVAQAGIAKVSEWAHASGPSEEAAASVGLPEIAASVVELAKWMQSKFDTALVPLLQKFSSSHLIRFGVDELVASFVPGAKTIAPAAAASSATPTDPKLAAKAKKEQEKKQKEEEERRKKDEKKKKEEDEKKRKEQEKEDEKKRKEQDKKAKDAEKAKKK